MTFKSLLSRIMYGPARIPGDAPVVNGESDEFEINNWIISRFVLTKLVPLVGYCPFPLNEQMLMVAAVCRQKPTHIFEWGTNIGVSARIFYETSKAFSIKAEIHSVDLPEDVEHVEHPKEMRGLLVRNVPGVTLHTGDGLDVSLGLLENLERGHRPLFFLDGDHGYDSVRRELEGIRTNAPHATILLHDTFCQSSASGYNTGPHRAIADIVPLWPTPLRILSQNMGLPGMTLLWHPEAVAP